MKQHQLLAGLKNSFDSELKTLNHSVAGLREETAGLRQETAASNAALKQEVLELKETIAADSGLKAEITQLKEKIDAQTKNGRLQWALNYCVLGSFKYYSKNSQVQLDSSELAQQALTSFRKGVGRHINDLGMQNYTHLYGPGSEEKIAASEKEFREKFQTQIHQLLGVSPRVEIFGDTLKYAIHYS
jgi:hypothetical protein